MAITDRIEKAFTEIVEKDYENATIQLSIAIDATAKKKYSKKLGNGARYKKFIEEHREFIIFFSLGCGAKIVLAEGAEMKFGERGTLANILYKYVRNALLHEGDVSDNIVFKEDPSLGHEGDKFIINPHMLWGGVVMYCR